MRHNERVLSFAAVTVDKSGADSVLVRPSGMQHNNYFDETEGASTGVSVGDCGQLGELVHNLRHNNIERPVQSPERAAQPLNLDGNGAPLPLEVVSLPVIDRRGEVERVAVTEVKPRPHAAIVLLADLGIFTAGLAAWVLTRALRVYRAVRS